MTPNKPSTVLSLVTEEATARGVVVWQRVLAGAHLACVVIGHPNGSGALGFDLSDEEIATHADFEEVGGLTFDSEEATKGVPGKWFAIHAFDPEDSRLFRSVVDDVCDGIVRAVESRRTELSAMSAEMRRWLRFLRAGRKGLSLPRQIGLWGELHVLRRLAAERSWPTALEWWTGPSHAAHDFSIDSFAIEVKASRTNQRNVRISSLEQLDDEGLTSLYLLNLKVDKVARDQGRSLTDVVEAIRGELGSQPDSVFRDFEARLLGSGYHDIHAPKYRRRAWVWSGTEIYQVDSNFPRLVRNNVAAGIAEATYGVDLGAATGSLRTIQDVANGPRSILEICLG